MIILNLRYEGQVLKMILLWHIKSADSRVCWNFVNSNNRKDNQTKKNM